MTGGVAEALRGADVLDRRVRRQRSPRRRWPAWRRAAIVFALANPTPEVHPEVGRAVRAVVATGRSDFPNQINNVLAFPGIFRGALDARATRITEGMKVAAAEAIAGVVADELRADAIVPSAARPAGRTGGGRRGRGGRPAATASAAAAAA